MMQLTNYLGLPAPLVRAIENDAYTPGPRRADYSTTGLIAPPRIAALRRAHRGELVEDASDRIWSLMGQITHGIIERAATDELAEKRLYTDIAGKVVSGQFDLLEGKILWDFKLTSIFSGKNGAKDEWTQQGNINRLLCEENGITIEGIQYVALYRDWSIMAARRKKNDDYPQKQVQIFNLPVWPLEKTRRFVEGRIALHEAAKEVLPECTDEERWARGEKWAVMRKGKKRAVRLHDDEAKAAAHAEGQKGLFVEHRPSESIRCRYFCSVLPFCTQGQRILATEDQPNSNDPILQDTNDDTERPTEALPVED